MPLIVGPWGLGLGLGLTIGLGLRLRLGLALGLGLGLLGKVNDFTPFRPFVRPIRVGVLQGLDRRPTARFASYLYYHQLTFR